MKIYIKTEMTEMPKSCEECDHSFFYDGYYCGINVKAKKMENMFPPLKVRPEWCPLVTRQEILEEKE